MSKLNLSVAIGDYDRNRPLIDGAVQIDGVDPVFMKLCPEEIFFRAFRTEDFDICELSLSSFTLKTAMGTCPYVGIPAFVSRCFRHTSIYVRTDRIKEPKDLRGKAVGVPEYQHRRPKHRNLHARSNCTVIRQIHLILHFHQHGGAVFRRVANYRHSDYTDKDFGHPE